MDRQVSNNVTELDLEKLGPILHGHLTDLPPISSRLVRIFISSTFSDMAMERNALMEHIYPQLKEFCRSNYGIEFQLIDLRWGIQAEAQEDHTTIDFCLREIDNCRRTSIGSSFVALLGQKYGYRPFPPNIASGEFVLLRDALLNAGYDVSLLDTWFKEDTNVIPEIYSLQPISSIMHEYNCKDDIAIREAAQQEWLEVFRQLQQLLRVAVCMCVENGVLTDEEKDKYFVSVTEYEIDRGMQSSGSHKDSLGFIRVIDDLDQHLDDPKAGLYTDITPGADRHLDTEAQDLLYYLRDIKLPKQLVDANLDRLHVTWDEITSDVPINTVTSHNKFSGSQYYIKKFCASFYDRVTALITSAMGDIENLASDTFVMEVLQHLFMCRSRCDIFRGRQDLIDKIRSYIVSESTSPLVVYGESGCGKTSVLAKAASLALQWLPQDASCKPVMVLRFLGTTARSTSIRLVLASVCWHLCVMYGLDITDIPADYPDIVTHFHELLKVATAAKPLLILLDSLDQLSTTHHAHQLSWLPSRLPPHVRLIVSALPYEYNLLATLKEKIPYTTDTYIEVLPLGQQVCVDMINDWLLLANRRLTSSQLKTVATALSQCSLPLYTKLVYEEVCRWHSYDMQDTVRLEYTVKGIISTLLERVERKHGHTFVSHALSYLTASSTGLSDAEMEDILSLDDAVLNDVYVHWIPPVRRIPPLLWPRLIDELSTYIVEREANGILVFYWYHRQFIAASQQRYLSDPMHKVRVHSMLADYYLGTWGGGKPKPVEGMKMSADRKVPLQPMHFGRSSKASPSTSLGVKVAHFYNLRKLSMLPYHLTKAGRVIDLKQEVLFNYNWLHTKLAATSLQDILSDFRIATESGLVDEEIQLLSNTLRVGGSYVNANPATLAFDLVGRLLPFYDQYKNVRSLLRQCDTSGVIDSALLPVFQCFESPRGMLMYILEEHTQCVLDLNFSSSTSELVSVSKDGTLAFWDMKNGERTRTVDVTALQPGLHTKIEQSPSGQYLVCDSDTVSSPIWILEQRTGTLLHSCSERKNTHRRCHVENNLLLRQNDLIDLRTGHIRETVNTFQKTDIYATVALTHNEKFILVAEGKATYMYAIDSKVPMASLPGDTIASKLVVSPDDRRLYAGYAVSCLFKVFDIDLHSDSFGKCTYQFGYQAAFPNTQFLPGTLYGRELAEIEVSPVNQCQVLLNIKHCHLAVCNIFSKDACLMDNVGRTDESVGYHPKLNNNQTAWEDVFLYGCTFSADGKYVIAGHSSYLYVWETRSGKHLSSITIHSVFKFPFAVSLKNNLVATGSNIHTAIKVWDLDRLKGTETTQFRIYENPVDLAACCQDKRVLFVKQYYPLNSGRGYHYIDWFGIDVWNLSTGTSQQFLPFGQYGRLIQMQTSSDLSLLALLLCNRNDTYVMIINLCNYSVHAVFQHASCCSFIMSRNRKFLVTSSSQPSGATTQNKQAKTVGGRELCLWSIEYKTQITRISDGHSATFSYNNQYMLCLQHDDVLMVVSLTDFTQMPHILWQIDQLQAIPCTPHIVLLTTLNGNTNSNSNNQRCSESESNEAVLYNFIDHAVEGHLKEVSSKGISSFSMDGTLCIDWQLQVFELPSGKLRCVIQERSEGTKSAENSENYERFSFVNLTYDGHYAIWGENLSIKVCRLSDMKIIGNMSTHEKPTMVQILDYGYMLAVGREDGHILTMKLIDPDASPRWIDCHRNTAWNSKSRTTALLSRCQCPEDVIETLEVDYQNLPEPLTDQDLPVASARLCQKLAKKAKVPHAIILTETTIDDTVLSPEEPTQNTANLVSPPNAMLRRRHSEGAARNRSDRRQWQRSVRGSLHEIFSPSKIIRSTSSLFTKQTSSNT